MVHGMGGWLIIGCGPVAVFRDPAAVKIVELDEACRRKQANDGCFRALPDVPTHAVTLTIPTLLAASHLYCVMPGPTTRPQREGYPRTAAPYTGGFSGYDKVFFSC